jgi:hypothetical protein
MTSLASPTLSAPQAIFLIGGLVNALVSALSGYIALWVRTRNLDKPMSRYSMVTHTGTLMNAALLFGFAFAIPYTPFIEPIKIVMAIAEVLATLFFIGRTILNWHRDFADAMAQGSLLDNRLRGLINVIHLFNATAMLYGVTRVAVGI